MLEAIVQGWPMTMNEKHLHSCCGRASCLRAEQRKLLLSWELQLVAACDMEDFFPLHMSLRGFDLSATAGTYPLANLLGCFFAGET